MAGRMHVRNLGRGFTALAAMLSLGLVATAQAAGDDTARMIAVRGTIVDESGAAVPGHVVRLIKSRSILSLGSLRTSDQAVEATRATTDAHGFFEFGAPLDPQFRYYYLRFYDPASFDKVRYRLPDDLEISAKARGGRTVQASVVLKTQPDWPQVKALIDQYGPGSHCGQILRSLGLPTSRQPQGEGRELWVYERDGVTYLVEGSKVIETRHTGTAAAAPQRDEPTEDAATPAVRVPDP